ncbi:MAG TPA: YdeI/OmpD-associated family protein [Candidatus Limnocylindria bacterium]|nr:YdeI/OmpD-associated family protein [Candidatus Limnocylindria bacterium]
MREEEVAAVARSAHDRPQVLVESRAEWRAWLSENHADSTGIWLVRWKKGRGPAVTYDEVVEEALCFGWVDSLPRSLDDDRTQLLLTPRKTTSRWSAVNKERVARLTASGAMAPAGLAMVRLAEESGTWVALDGVDALLEPPDLAAALDADPAARASWDGFPPSARRGILEWILDARTAPTREKRIATTVAEAHDGRRANQWPKSR